MDRNGIPNAGEFVTIEIKGNRLIDHTCENVKGQVCIHTGFCCSKLNRGFPKDVRYFEQFRLTECPVIEFMDNGDEGVIGQKNSEN